MVAKDIAPKAENQMEKKMEATVQDFGFLDSGYGKEKKETD